MFDKYGEFDSSKEINDKAAELKAAGDTQGLKTLAIENGLDKEDVQDYIDGTISELTTPALAAIGKIAVEAQDIKAVGMFVDWVGHINVMCSQSVAFAQSVRKKGKNLIDCFAEVIEEEFKNRGEIDQRITKKVKGCPQRLGISTLTTKEQIGIITQYYRR